MRSWGTSSVGDDRLTQLFPTASAILGLTGACMGVDHHSSQQVEAWYNGFWVCTLSAVAYKKVHLNRIEEHHIPTLLTDYQTTRNSLMMSNKVRGHAVVSHRGYITDGLDVAALIPKHTDAEQWLEQLGYALQQPRFTPYLGRRSNVLATPLAEPGESVVKSDSIEGMCEMLFLRLSTLTLGDLQPTECVLRLPMELEGANDAPHEKWNAVGTATVADHRSSVLRVFENRKVRMYNRSF